MGMEQLIPNPVEHMEYLAKTYLPLARWGFKESYRSNEDKRLIFESEWCKVKFVWGNWDMYTSYDLSIYYGRLHAPSEKVRLTWNGEECRCWHSLFGTSPVLDYLDGLTPQESTKSTSKRVWEQVGVVELQKQWKTERQKDERLTLVVGMKMEAAIWEYYGLSLFELFDLRKPELWEKYRLWLREQYVAKGMDEERDKQFGITVPYYRVC